MVVKDKVGRKRYILAELIGRNMGRIPRGSLIHQVNTNFGRYARKNDMGKKTKPPWLTVFEDGYAIFRCGHVHKESVVEFLNALTVFSPRRSGGSRGPGKREDVRKEQEEGIDIRTLRTSGTIRKLKKEIEFRKQRSSGGSNV